MSHFRIEPVTFVAISPRSRPARNGRSLHRAQQEFLGLVGKIRPKLRQCNSNRRRGDEEGSTRPGATPGRQRDQTIGWRRGLPRGTSRAGVALDACLCGLSPRGGTLLSRSAEPRCATYHRAPQGPARIVRSARVPTGPAPRDTFRPPPPLAQGDVGCVEQGSWAKSTVRNGPSATQATPYALACFASSGTCGAQAAGRDGRRDRCRTGIPFGLGRRVHRQTRNRSKEHHDFRLQLMPSPSPARV